MSCPVDEEGRGTAHAAMPPAFGVLIHLIGKNMGAHIPLEALGIQRVCVKFSRVASYQASEHDAKHGNVNPALLTFRQVFIVLAQAT